MAETPRGDITVPKIDAGNKNLNLDHVKWVLGRIPEMLHHESSLKFFPPPLRKAKKSVFSSPNPRATKAKVAFTGGSKKLVYSWL
jgi:hypothetical protein